MKKALLFTAILALSISCKKETSAPEPTVDSIPMETAKPEELPQQAQLANFCDANFTPSAVYQVKGQIAGNAAKTELGVMLPDRANAGYKIYSCYNVSTASENRVLLHFQDNSGTDLAQALEKKVVIKLECDLTKAKNVTGNSLDLGKKICVALYHENSTTDLSNWAVEIFDKAAVMDCASVHATTSGYTKEMKHDIPKTCGQGVIVP